MYGLASLGIIVVAGIAVLVIYPSTGIFVVSMIKIGVITFIIEKGVKLAGKKEYGEIITVAGWSLVGVQMISAVGYMINNPPKWWMSLKAVNDSLGGIANSIGKVGKFFGVN